MNIASMMKDIILIIAVAILLPVVTHLGIHAFYPRPRYRDFVTAPYCGSDAYYQRRPQAKRPSAAQCQERKRQQEQYYQLRRRYHEHYLFITVFVGSIAIIAGLLLNAPAIAGGLLLGGVMNTLTGVIATWTDISTKA